MSNLGGFFYAHPNVCGMGIFEKMKGKQMSLVKLGNRPKTFKPVTLTAPMPDGSEGKMPVTFKYFTKTESGKMFDELIAAAKLKDATVVGADSPEFSLETIMSKTREQNAAYMLRVLDSWGIDEPLNIDSLQQLDDELPAVAARIMEAFREAAHSGKLGN